MKNLYKLSLLVFLTICTLALKAQNPITTLQHAGTTQVFYGQNSFVEAYNAAVNGDTLNLSVGGFTPPNTIEKGITIVGAGYLPDSVSYQRRTSINGNIDIRDKADNLHLEGLYIGSHLFVYGNISNLKVIRCRFIDAFSARLYSPVINNCFFEECIVEGNFAISATPPSHDFLLRHCVINNDAEVSQILNIVVEGNIFLKGRLMVSSATVKNNIFLHMDIDFSQYGGFINFYNNIYADSSVVYGSNYNYSSNDYCGIAQSDIFINQTGNSFDYAHNYHLKNPEKYIGTDGTQVGLYGGLTPFKDGGAPSNPQVTSKTIARETDTEGNLKVDITVKAQEN